VTQAQSSLSNGLLKVLPQADYLALAPHLRPMNMTLREMIASAGARIDSIIFPESGMLSLVAQNPVERVEVGIVGREGAGGAAAVFGVEHHAFAMLCQAEGWGHRIDSGEMRRAVRQSSALAAVMGRYLNNFTIQVGQTAYANAALNLEAKLARWILMSDDRIDSFELPLTHEFLSAMLGVRRPGVTTAIHVLEGARMIRAERGSITVLDRPRLIDLARDAYGGAEDDYAKSLGAKLE
jgi:CRP-like cAMP-binding protein